MSLKTIVLEDEPLVAETIAQMLRDLGHEVSGVAHSAHELPALLAAHEPDLITIDVNLGDRHDGVGVATLLEAAGCLPIVFITGEVDDEERGDILAVDGSTLLLKPFTSDQLAAAIREAVQRAQEDCSPELGP
jgi:DNA-binding response OmpR family regulator